MLEERRRHGGVMLLTQGQRDLNRPALRRDDRVEFGLSDDRAHVVELHLSLLSNTAVHSSRSRAARARGVHTAARARLRGAMFRVRLRGRESLGAAGVTLGKQGRLFEHLERAANTSAPQSALLHVRKRLTALGFALSKVSVLRGTCFWRQRRLTCWCMDLLNSTHRTRAALLSPSTVCRARAVRARRGLLWTSWMGRWALALCAVFALSAAARPCRADEAPTIFGYGLEGLGTGLSTGLAVGYLATGPTYDSGEWKKLVYGTAVGGLTGLGVGVLLGIIDASSGKDRGVGFYMIRDSNYGVTLGFLVGGIVGVLRWVDDGSGKDLLRGMAWGTVIGAGSGLLVGAIEGALRLSSRSEASVEASASRVRLGIGFAPGRPGSVGMPYPTLSGRF